MSSPNHSTSNIEDVFSSMNILNYTSVSSDYFPTSSESSSFNSSENFKDNMIPPVFLPFYNNPCLKDVQAFYAKELPISPPDPITSPAILTPSLVLPPSLIFEPRYFFVPGELLPPKKRILYTPTPPQIFEIGKKSLLDAVWITAAHVCVNAAQLELVLLRDFKENMLNCSAEVNAASENMLEVTTASEYQVNAATRAYIRCSDGSMTLKAGKFKILEWEERIEKCKEDEIEFGKWKSKVFDDKDLVGHNFFIYDHKLEKDDIESTRVTKPYEFESLFSLVRGCELLEVLSFEYLPPSSTKVMSTENGVNPLAPNPAHKSNFSLLSVLERERLTGPNYMDWMGNLRFTLRYQNKKYVMDEEIPTINDDSTQKEIKAHQKHYDDANKVSCIMASSMSPELQKTFENTWAYEMNQQLKEMFQAKESKEHLNVVKSLMACKPKPGASICYFVLEMKGSFDRLESMNMVFDAELSINIILSGLPADYNQILLSYQINEKETSIIELHSLLQTAKYKRKDESEIAPTSDPKEAVCFYCNTKGHWKRSCPKYLKDLKNGKVKKDSHSGSKGK
ncbi:retrotransposon protein, putative, ty1-copia subclass [Tanacetum coccineum]|uniref:Retrotransposon protein, putative, ty1-copia subclass n=1 Tax=Tanacetum coccineum TaxID=301880 RepID=A0ABQ5F2B7_9ASTR